MQCAACGQLASKWLEILFNNFYQTFILLIYSHDLIDQKTVYAISKGNPVEWTSIYEVTNVILKKYTSTCGQN